MFFCWIVLLSLTIKIKLSDHNETFSLVLRPSLLSYFSGKQNHYRFEDFEREYSTASFIGEKVYLSIGEKNRFVGLKS